MEQLLTAIMDEAEKSMKVINERPDLPHPPAYAIYYSMKHILKESGIGHLCRMINSKGITEEIYIVHNGLICMRRVLV